MTLTKQEQEAIEAEAIKRFPKEFSDFNSYRQSGYRVGATAYALKAKVLESALQEILDGDKFNVLAKETANLALEKYRSNS